MTASDVLLIPVPLTILLDKAEEQHAAAHRAGAFDLADGWGRVRDGLVDVLFERRDR